MALLRKVSALFANCLRRRRALHGYATFHVHAGALGDEDELLRTQSEIVLPCGLHAGNAALHLNRYRIHVAKPLFERVALENRSGARLPEKHLGRLASRIDLVRGCLAKLDPCREAHCAGRLALVPRLVKQLHGDARAELILASAWAVRACTQLSSRSEIALDGVLFLASSRKASNIA